MRLVHHPDPVCYYCVLGGHVFALVATMARTVCRSQQIAPWRHPAGAGEEEGSPVAGTRATEHRAPGRDQEMLFFFTRVIVTVRGIRD